MSNRSCMTIRTATLPVLFALASFGAEATSSEPSGEYQKLERGALAGNYQDQRNLAYWLSGGYGGAAPTNPVLACAWRIVILNSGDRRVDEGDVSNKQLYCDKRLDKDAQQAAKAQSEKLLAQVKKRK